MPEPLTWDDLIRFHREFIAPEFEKVFAQFDAIDRRFDDVFPHFDAVCLRLDRLAMRSRVEELEQNLPS